MESPEGADDLDPEEQLVRSEQMAARATEGHECDSALRQRTFANKSVHVVRQCSICGEQRGGPLSKAAAKEALQGAKAEPFDEGLTSRYREARHTLWKEATAMREQALQLLDPEEHAFIARWRESNAAAREDQAQRRATSIAALDAAFAEALALNGPMGFADLAGQAIDKLAAACRLPPEGPPPPRFSSEAELREWIEGWLDQDFDWTAEVSGRHLTEGVPVKIDYILHPKQHLVDAGFKPGPIGMEAKYLNQDKDKGFATKASRLVWQAVSYTDCEFHLAGQTIRLPRVLLFTNLSFAHELRLLRGVSSHALTNDRAKWTAMLEVANHANVGVFEIAGRRDGWTGWRIAFATGKYFNRQLKNYELQNAHLFEKVRVGNF